MCNEVGKPDAKPFGTASAQPPSMFTTRVKCDATILVVRTSATGIAVVGDVGVNSASTPASAASIARRICSRFCRSMR